MRTVHDTTTKVQRSTGNVVRGDKKAVKEHKNAKNATGDGNADEGKGYEGREGEYKRLGRVETKKEYEDKVEEATGRREVETNEKVGNEGGQKSNEEDPW